jgi:hypothetical protein
MAGIPYYSIVPCCQSDGTALSFFNFPDGVFTLGNGVFRYLGTTQSINGVDFITDHCYTITQEGSVFTNYPYAPNEGDFTNTSDCTDLKCAPCVTPPLPCPCPPGFNDVKGECRKQITEPAVYSGQLFTLTAGNKSRYYCDSGLRLYPDITSLTWPILGDGSSNATYVLKENNGSGATVSPTANVTSEVWGKGTNPCSTVTNASCPGNTCGGRLNIAGVWATGFPVNKELAFEFCINVEGKESKQYMLGIAGDNYVKFYIDGNLAVFLDTPNDNVTTPFRHWHTFPITLTGGNHTIKLAGLNLGSSAAFAAEIYDITLPQFQATLMAPAVAVGNCGTSPSQLAPYIIFSTSNMVGRQVANPNQEGQWSCPNGGELDLCSGTPVCIIDEKVNPICACYLIIPCNNTTPFISQNTDFENYVDGFVFVESKEYSGCAYITQVNDSECLNAIEATPQTEEDCNCKLKCYYIYNSKGFIYVDADDVLQEVSELDARPFIKVCSKVYPVLQSEDREGIIIPLGDCIEGECPTLCFKLISCENKNEVFYSNSDTLLSYVYGDNNVIRVLNKPGCWKVELSSDADCNCLEVTIITNQIAQTVTATVITTYNGYNVFTFVYQGVTYYIWNEAGEWFITTLGYGPQAGTTIAYTKYPGDCPTTSTDVDLFPWNSKSDIFNTIITEKCPALCDCPVDVTITASYETCETCIGSIAYKLTSCTNNDVIYTLFNLEDYIGQVVKLDCGCYLVEQILYLPPNPQVIKLEDIYPTCIECTRTYWILEDCAGIADPIITYSLIGAYSGKVVKIENCLGCWNVSPTELYEGATTVVVTNEYEDCTECGIPPVAECSTITNLNQESKTYCYLDVDNNPQSITLEPGETSDKICVLQWIECETCQCVLGQLDILINPETQETTPLYVNFEVTEETSNGKPIYRQCYATYNNCSYCLELKYSQTNCWYINQTITQLIPNPENLCKDNCYPIYKLCSDTDCPLSETGWEYVSCAKISITISQPPFEGEAFDLNAIDPTQNIFSYASPNNSITLTYNEDLARWELKELGNLIGYLPGTPETLCSPTGDLYQFIPVDPTQVIDYAFICDKDFTGKMLSFTTVPCIDNCDCIEITYTDTGLKIPKFWTSTFIVTGEIINGCPVYQGVLIDNFGTTQVYFDGTNWVIDTQDSGVVAILPQTTGCCPIGTWEQYVPNAANKAEQTGLLEFSKAAAAASSITITSNLCQELLVQAKAKATRIANIPAQFTYLDYVQTFGECKFGNCPPPVFINNRTVKPGYNTPICSAEKYDKITCKFADIMYKLALEKRYGITNCCPEEDDKWLVQKELIDLQALKDPNYKCEECGCNCQSNSSCQTCNCKN